MPVSYSMDFRRAVLAHVESGVSCSQASRVFGTSRSFVINLMRRYRETGELSPRLCGGANNTKLMDVQADVIGWVHDQPSITLQEIAMRLLEHHDLKASSSGLSDMLRRSGFTYKKIHAGGRGRSWTPQTETA